MAKWWCEESLEIAEKKRGAKCKGERERYTQLNAEFWRQARKYKKAILSKQCKETEENNRMGKTTRQRLAEWILKQDQELTVAQIMNSLLPNSDLN